MNNTPFDSEDDFDSTTRTVRFPTEYVGQIPSDQQNEVRKNREQKIHELSLVLHKPDDDFQACPPERRNFEKNLRQFSRCPVVDDRSMALLTVNGRKFNCRLVQMSIGGFGVIVTGKPKFESGAIGQLTTSDTNYIVAVSRQEWNDDGLYVGLRQIEEVIDPDQMSRDQSPLISYVIAGLAAAFVVAGTFSFMLSK